MRIQFSQIPIISVEVRHFFNQQERVYTLIDHQRYMDAALVTFSTVIRTSMIVMSAFMAFCALTSGLQGNRPDARVEGVASLLFFGAHRIYKKHDPDDAIDQILPQ